MMKNLIPQSSDQEKKSLALAGLVFISASALTWWLLTKSGIKLFPGDLVNPAAGADIAGALPSDEDQFIMSAWDYVASTIQYQGYSSKLYFVDSSIRCLGCQIPEVTLKEGRGNCVSMSSLLASILRNRLPPERVFMCIGETNFDGIGGHAWDIVQRRNGQWYLLESTRQPTQWMPASLYGTMYQPFTYLNDHLLYCMNPQICKIKSCNCQEIMLSYS